MFAGGGVTRVELMPCACQQRERKRVNLQGSDIVLGALHECAELLHTRSGVGCGHDWDGMWGVMRWLMREKKKKEASESEAFLCLSHDQCVCGRREGPLFSLPHFFHAVQNQIKDESEEGKGGCLLWIRSPHLFVPQNTIQGLVCVPPQR